MNIRFKITSKKPRRNWLEREIKHEASNRPDRVWLDHHRGKKKLSKAVYGTSHTISLDEAKHVYQKGTEELIIGAGQDGNVVLSDEAATYFERKRCQVKLLPTPGAIRIWNKTDGAVIGLFHVTC
jgi:hypothetical protein